MAKALPFVGRSAETQSLTELLVRTSNGEGGTALVIGEAGIGKSELLRRVTADAQRRGFRVFAGECTEFERGRPFWAFVQALDLRSSATDNDAARIGARLEAAATARELDTADSMVRFAIADEIVGLVESHATTAPVVLVIEDLHWADAGTLLALHLIGRRVGSLTVAVLSSMRPVPANADLEALLTQLRSAGTLQLTLESLDGRDAAELVRLTLAAEPGAGLRDLVRRAGGNPLFIQELVSALLREELITIDEGVAECPPGVVPPALHLTILQRLSFVSEASLELLRAAAILGRRFSVAELTAVTGDRAAALAPSIRELRDAGLVSEAGADLTFRHDLVRDAVYQDLPEGLRRSLHRDAAVALEDAGFPDARVAVHYAIGAATGDKRAGQCMWRAAAELLGTDPRSAIALLERALEVVPAGDELAPDIRATAVIAFGRVGRLSDAIAAGRELMTATGDPMLRLRVSRVVARSLAAQARFIDAAEVLEDAAPASGADRLRVVAEAAYWRVWADPSQYLPVAESMLAAAQEARDDDAIFWSTAAFARAIGFDGHVRRMAELLEDLGPDFLQAQSERTFSDEITANLAWSLCYADRFDIVERWLATPDRNRVDGPTFAILSGLIAYVTGEWEDATTLIDRDLEYAREAQVQTGLGIVLANRAALAIYRDDFTTARERIDDLAPLPAYRPWQVWPEALCHEASGDVAALDDVLDEFVALLKGHPYRRLVFSYAARDVVRMSVGRAKTDTAVAVVEELEEFAERAQMPWCSALAYSCRGLLDRDVDLLIKSVAEARNSPRPFILAESLEWAGNEFARRDEAARAAPLLTEAAEIYERLGAARHLNRVDALLRSVGAPRRTRRRRQQATAGWDSLTDRELEIARLVAAGLSYREIGERLFVSRRTVETHVAHIFVKLGIRTRAALTDEVRAHP